MKVYDVNLTGPSASESGRAQETQKADRESNSRTAAANSSGDRVELSGTMARISRAVSSYSADRSNKVQALAQQYRGGNYRPDSVKTSQGMIAEAQGSGTR
jgi:anti-sigma28 factor (negative regulator of flagellin synthesis)